MKLRLRRQRQTCSGSALFYTCSTGFSGCCSVDPCTSSGCPDGSDAGSSSARPASSIQPSSDVISSSPVASSSSTAPEVSIQTSPNASTTTSPPVRTSSTASSSSSSGPTSTGKTTSTATSATSQSLTSIPSITTSTSDPSLTATPGVQKASNSTAVIAGAVVGATIGLVLLALLLICWGKRRRLKASSLPSSIHAFEQTSSFPEKPPSRAHDPKDIFAEFGGYFHRSGSRKASYNDGKTPGSSSRTSQGVFAATNPQVDSVALPSASELPGSPVFEADSKSLPHRANTEASTFSIPIALGSPSTPPQASSNAEDDKPSNSSFEDPVSAIPSTGRRSRSGPHVMSWADFQNPHASTISQSSLAPSTPTVISSNRSSAQMTTFGSVSDLDSPTNQLLPSTKFTPRARFSGGELGVISDEKS